MGLEDCGLLPADLWPLTLNELRLLQRHHSTKWRQAAYAGWAAGYSAARAWGEDGLPPFEEAFPLGEEEGLTEGYTVEDCEEIAKGLNIPQRI
jgi:hypothetical protein